MVNNNRNRKNQPPTGEGKHQSRFRGEPRKLEKRSEGVQAQRHHPELNLGDTDEETAKSEEHTSELQSRLHLVCRLLLEKKKEQPHQDKHQPPQTHDLPPSTEDGSS